MQRGGCSDAHLGMGVHVTVLSVTVVCNGVALEVFLHSGGLVRALPVLCVPLLDANSCVVVTLGVAVGAT